MIASSALDIPHPADNVVSGPCAPLLLASVWWLLAWYFPAFLSNRNPFTKFSSHCSGEICCLTLCSNCCSLFPFAVVYSSGLFLNGGMYVGIRGISELLVFSLIFCNEPQSTVVRTKRPDFWSQGYVATIIIPPTKCTPEQSGPLNRTSKR